MSNLKGDDVSIISEQVQTRQKTRAAELGVRRNYEKENSEKCQEKSAKINGIFPSRQ